MDDKMDDRVLRIALFQFATNAVGKVPAIFESMLALYLINAMERAAGLQVVDLMPPSSGGDIVSLAQMLTEDEVRGAAGRVGADLSVWGSTRFVPDGEPVIEGAEIVIMAAGEDRAQGHSFVFDALRGDVRTGILEVEMAALEDLVEDILVHIARILDLDSGRMRLSRIGEGLSHSDRAVGYFVYALRIADDPEDKQRLYLKAIATDPDFALAYTNAAQLFLGEGRYGEAMKLLLRAETRIKGGKLEPDVLNLLGVATMHMGMWDDAVRVWKRALDIDDEHVEVLCNLASAHAMREMPEEAEEYYNRALSSKADYPLAWFSLGRLQAREEKYEEAEVSMRHYIELCPGDPWAYYILGTSLANLGKDDEAEFALAKASQLDPDGEAGTMARRELYELKE
ncbi:MAG: tetratricopeptide repeat protein [Actinobacteria bacterium]|nr:tetratricopeptide repeat protein [Actinomycetota bacterium]